MSYFVNRSDNELSQLNLEEERYINILLLGETGTGKSTFINAFANYLSFENLRDAEDNFLVLIASIFQIQDKHRQYHSVLSKPNRKSKFKKRFEIGQSVTQNVNTYIFPLGRGRTKLRLINSPGVGDTRGPQQDLKNCEYILNYITQLDVLHGICCLFSSTNSRISVLFEYCLNEILSRLEKSASNNLIFVFTKTRADNYTPGDTYAVLRERIGKIEQKSPGLKIPMEHNIFSFENDSFRYLAAAKNNIEFDRAAIENYKQSWNISRDECWRLITYIIGDKTHPPLRPHLIQDTVSINEARRIIQNLSKPLADVSQLIQDNLNIMERYRENLNFENESLDELRAKLHMPVVNLKVTQLSEPVTVCTSFQCSEIYMVESVKKYHYKQRCHNLCYLKNVPSEIIGSPELVHCWAINPETRDCHQCGCDFSTHMHIYYETTTVSETVIDCNIQSNIESKEQALEEISAVISGIETRKQEFEQERVQIIKIMASFAHFLQHKAISPINDAFERYITYLINREEKLGRAANEDYIIQMVCLLNEYVQAKKVFEDALKETPAQVENLTPQMVMNNVQKLYSLRHMGGKIRELMESQMNAHRVEHRRSDYVHRACLRQPRQQPGGFMGALFSVIDGIRTYLPSSQERERQHDNPQRGSNPFVSEYSSSTSDLFQSTWSNLLNENYNTIEDFMGRSPETVRTASVGRDIPTTSTEAHRTVLPPNPPSYESLNFTSSQPFTSTAVNSQAQTSQTPAPAGRNSRTPNSSNSESEETDVEAEQDVGLETPRSYRIPPNPVVINVFIVLGLIVFKYLLDYFFFN